MRALVIVALLCAPALAAAQPNSAQTPATARPSDAALLRNCDGLFSLPKTYALARNWVDAWNSTSVDRVMSLYAPGFEFRARGILSSNRKSSPDGALRGQADNRLRWFDPAAADLKTSSQFRLIDAFAGVHSIAVHYLNASSEPVVEVMEFTPDCKIERSSALYGVLPVGVPSTWADYPTTSDGISIVKPASLR